MQHIELTYLKPFRVLPGSVFDYRIPSASETLARTHPPADRVDEAPDDSGLLDGGALGAGVRARPVSLLETNGGHVVIDGHRRMNGAARLDLESIPALIYPDNTPRETLVSLSVEGKGNMLTGVEKIIALYKTTLFATGNEGDGDIPVASPPLIEVPDWISPFHRVLVGRPVSTDFVMRLLRVLTFPATELRSLHDFALTVESLVPLLDLEPFERAGFLTLRRLSPLTTAEGRELIRLLILARGRSAFELEPWIDGLTAETSEHEGKSCKGSTIIRSLKHRIHPTLTRRQQEIGETIETMRLSNRLRISPPENLEGDSFSCYVRFSRVEELQRYIDVLQKAVTDGSVGRILDLLEEKGTE